MTKTHQREPVTDVPLRCDCCGGQMPPYDIWEARRDEAGDCAGHIDPHTDRCRAWVDDDLWTSLEDE